MSLYERESTFREGSSPASQVLDPAVTEQITPNVSVTEAKQFFLV